MLPAIRIWVRASTASRANVNLNILFIELSGEAYGTALDITVVCGREGDRSSKGATSARVKLRNTQHEQRAPQPVRSKDEDAGAALTLAAVHESTPVKGFG